jgi:preprotein translocase subunit SecE
VAKGKSKKKSKPKENVVARYLRETWAELRKVRWPTWEETWNLTKIVMAVTITMALFLWALDVLFDRELNGIIGLDPIAIGVVAVVLVAGVLAVVLLNRRAA